MSLASHAVVGTTTKRPAAGTHGGSTGAIGAAGDGSSSSGCGLKHLKHISRAHLQVSRAFVERADSSSFGGPPTTSSANALSRLTSFREHSF